MCIGLARVTLFVKNGRTLDTCARAILSLKLESEVTYLERGVSLPILKEMAWYSLEVMPHNIIHLFDSPLRCPVLLDHSVNLSNRLRQFLQVPLVEAFSNQFFNRVPTTNMTYSFYNEPRYHSSNSLIPRMRTLNCMPANLVLAI